MIFEQGPETGRWRLAPFHAEIRQVSIPRALGYRVDRVDVCKQHDCGVVGWDVSKPEDEDVCCLPTGKSGVALSRYVYVKP
jgi:hypothetical protein